MKLLPLLLAIILASCSPEAEFSSTETKSLAWTGKVKSVDYDGHKWLVFTTDRGGSMTHHPDCPCLKKP